MDNKKEAIGTIPGYEMSTEVLDLFAEWIKNTESTKERGLLVTSCGLKATVDSAVTAEAEIQAKASSDMAATQLAKEVFIENTRPSTPRPIIDLAEFSFAYGESENKMLKITLKGFLAAPKKG